MLRAVLFLLAIQLALAGPARGDRDLLLQDLEERADAPSRIRLLTKSGEVQTLSAAGRGAGATEPRRRRRGRAPLGAPVATSFCGQ